MTEDFSRDRWNVFENSGRVADYLYYKGIGTFASGCHSATFDSSIGRFSIIAVMTASFSLRQALRRQAEKVIEALARFRYQALRMIFDLL